MHTLIAFALAVVAMPAARRVGVALGLVDRPKPGPLKIHVEPIPHVGGVAVVGATLAAVAILGWDLPATLSVPVGGMLILGFADDVRPLPLVARLALQVGAGLLVALRLPLDPIGILAVPGTVVLFAATTNSVNLMDGQDGLAGGLCALAALGMAGAAAAAGFGASPLSGLGLAVAGALMGFLIWNRPPAKIFLGNGGAYAVGAILSMQAADLARRAGGRGLVAAALCLGVFAFEIPFTLVRRWLARELASMRTGDRRHSYDLLARRVGRGRSTVMIWAIGASAAAAGIAASSLSVVVAAGLAVAALAAAVGAGAALYRIDRSLSGKVTA